MYTIDGGKNNHTFSGLRKTINQNVWASIPDGPITLQVYAIDLAGNIGYDEVEIEKVFEIPGFDLITILGIIGIILPILAIFSQKRIKKTN